MVGEEAAFECLRMRREGAEVGGEKGRYLAHCVAETLADAACAVAEVAEPSAEAIAFPSHGKSEVCLVAPSHLRGDGAEKYVGVNACVATEVCLESGEPVSVEI